MEEENKIKKGTQLLLEALEKQNVEVIFGYPGGAVLPLYDELYDSNIRHILARHEQGAVHAAEGYAKASGKPGVVIATSGPGATNVLTGIADAMGDSVPLVVFTGQVATSGIGKDAFQEADIMGLTMPITKYNYQVRCVKDLPKIINEAFHIATSGRKGPVVIDLPKDISTLETDEPKCDDIELESYQPTYEPHRVQVTKLLENLSRSKKPLVLAGAGVIGSGASQELMSFIRQYELPVVNTLLGLGTVPHDYELFLGMGGMHGSYAANMAITECDLLINFGSRFDDRLASCPDKFAAGATIVHVDIDPAEIGKVVNTDIPIVGDIKRVLQRLLEDEVEKVSHDEWKERNLSRAKAYPFTFDRQQKDEIKPQRVIELIGEITKGEAIVVTDVGQHQMWAAQYYPFSKEKQIITSGGLGTMGYGIPAAIGAKIACPDKEVVVFVGDGGFQMTNQELAILNHYQLSIKFVLLNNHSLGMVRQWQECFFDERRSESVFADLPDFVKLAEAYRIKGKRIDNPLTFEEELKEAFDEQGSMLIEVVISPTEHVLPMVPAGKNNDEMIGVE